MIESAFAILEVEDIGAALGFYRDGLGGRLTYRFPPEGQGEPVYVSLQVGRSELGIGLADGPRGSAAQAPFVLWFYVDDVDTVTAALAARGAPVLEPPADQPWGERVSLVADPFGTRVRLGASGTAADRT
ncbi:glyoxalase/bleomycin resistance/extradiol dioxygenase family protein [Occultella aeris]|uniref:Glyoxalase-like domain protein n=1 Tax=Occultella aeris TaxID=2761496 RepID=A0A7M4DT75_9MICO|nr:glyoxalase superfamily protein [Occultella aeris]VZO40669.1 Glyoxalase-like domain protein [Occultella aeris]